MPDWSAERRVRAHAAAAGREPAVLEASGTTTWAELDRRCDAVAAMIAGAGLPRGALVAVIAEPSADAIAAVLGVMRAGAVVAPVPAGGTAAELALAMEVLRPALVLPEVRIRAAIDAGLPFEPANGTPDAASAAVVVLTSGTTGRPRGVVLSGRAMAASAESWLGFLPPATGWLLALGLGHVAGLGVLWRAIAGRVPLRIAGRADPVAMLAALAAEPGTSHGSLVPAQLPRLLDAAAATTDATTDAAGQAAATTDAAPPPTLRAVLLGGGPILPELVTRAVTAGWPVVTTFGLSEAGSGVTALPTREALAAPGTAGYPLPGVTVAIDAPDADGIGEIVVESPAAFSGYLGEPPRAPGAPVRTGDLGRLDEAGRLVVVDRRTDRIVRGGENIDPAEVEAALRAHPVVEDAAVVGVPDPAWGQVPLAAIVLRAGTADPGDEALARHLRASIAGFKVPAAAVRLDALPRTPAGKLRRRAVRALLAGEPEGELARPGGDAIGWRVTGAGPGPMLLLPGTLSTAAQLDRLAAALAAPGGLTVHALDRRGSGSSRLARPRPLDVAVHVADVVAYLDARGIDRAGLTGVSFGGVVALELAARHPQRIRAVVAYEPPYGPLAEPATRDALLDVAAAVARAHAAGGAPAAAETFLRAVAGDAAWDRLSPRARAFLEGEGDGALADAGLAGLEPDGLARILAPVAILTGGASEPFYAPIADALAARIPGARRATLDGLAHPAPITQPDVVAAAIIACLEPVA